MPYAELREKFKPKQIKWLLIPESPPPHENMASGRHFYRVEPRTDDRLFVNTIKSLYLEAAEQTEAQLEPVKEQWLRRLQQDGVYVVEALEKSLQRKVTKPERQGLLRQVLPRLIERLQQLAQSDTRIILIKSNVFEVLAEPLKRAGFKVLNRELVDYPGRFNQRQYREKLSQLVREQGWNK